MSWATEHSLAARLARTGEERDRLPTILCGPILRRTETDSVTVWVALKKAHTVTLRVYSHAPPPALESLREEMQGTRRTVQLGEHLHVVAITALPVAADRPLTPGTLYFYNLFFSETDVSVVPETGKHLNSPNIFALDVATDSLQPSNLSYSLEHPFPSFSLPPQDLNKLRIIHGTCRKPDGKGRDALPAVDEMIDLNWHLADERPHLLMLNGDQIYADDVASTVLFLLMDADKSLLGWNEQEKLPGVISEDSLKPGERTDVVKKIAKFTSQDTENHLLRAGEYFAMHLFSWSDVLWPTQLPPFETVYPNTFPNSSDNPDRWDYDEDGPAVMEFRKTLRNVRRALANVPTYMMFDDHDVTDDWNMLRDWCERVYASQLGRRVVQNGLLSYALFQAWGNTPERFSAGQPGEALLTAASAWLAAKGNAPSHEQEIARLVGIPGQLSASGELTGLFTSVGDLFRLSRADDALKWHYSIKGPQFEILVLDSRTQREFTQDKYEPPAHLGPAAVEEQIPLENADPNKLFIVVATTNVLTIPFFHGSGVYGDKFIWSFWYIIMRLFRGLFFSRLVKWIMDASKYNPDLSDSWKPQTKAFESLLSRIARRIMPENGRRTARVLFLSGDVHFSWASRMQYWAERPFEAADSPPIPIDAVFAHLTSSPFKKEEIYGPLFHKWGYIPMTDRLPDPIKWFGWKDRSSLGVSPQDMGRMANWVEMESWMSRHTPPMLSIIDAPGTHSSTASHPDWRYRIDFILGEKSGIDFSLNLLTKPNPNDHENWLEVFGEAHQRYKDYAQKWGHGIEIIGKNNIAELQFQWGADTALTTNLFATGNAFFIANPTDLPSVPFLLKIDNEILKVGTLDRDTGLCSEIVRGQRGTTAASHTSGTAVEVFHTVTQTHWWRLTGETKLTPLTKYTVSLSYNDPQFSKPKMPGEQNS
jgi:hypothetical protein